MKATHATAEQRENARRAVLDGLARLRATFPLEARLASAPETIRDAYARILAHWLRGEMPPTSCIDAVAMKTLQQLDAIVPGPQGIGCYPFSTRDTGISLALPGGTVSAMCAIDALAIARLAEQHVTLHAHCAACEAPLKISVESDGSLDHDQSGRAHVVWRARAQSTGSCSENLCLDLQFVCTTCEIPGPLERYTLPMAAAMGNAFFAFQRSLLDGRQ